MSIKDPEKIGEITEKLMQVCEPLLDGLNLTYEEGVELTSVWTAKLIFRIFMITEASGKNAIEKELAGDVCGLF